MGSLHFHLLDHSKDVFNKKYCCNTIRMSNGLSADLGRWSVCLFVCVFVLLLYVPSQQLCSLRDGQFT